MEELIRNPEFFVSIAVIIGFAVIIWKASPLVTGTLDSRATKIKTELDEARKLRDDAQRMLAEYQRKQRDALKEAEQIVALSRAEAERAAAQAAKDLEAALQRRQAQALEKIALEEAKATAEVRNTVVDVAVAAVRRMLAEELGAAQKSRLIDDAISELPKLLH
jgi:F-type H+-transporting ATPase subunit b